MASIEDVQGMISNTKQLNVANGDNVPDGAALRSDTSSPGDSDVVSATPSCSSRSTTSSRTLNPLAHDFRPNPSEQPPPPAASDFYELRSVPGKGVGLFATRFIPVGTRIICESPLLSIPDNALCLAWGPYCRLSNAQKAAYDKLHSFAPMHLTLQQASRLYLIDPTDRDMDEEDVEEAVAEHVRVMSIFACNNFKLPSGGLGVFETASRLNHSCVPNVHHSFNPTLQKQIVHATRDVTPGEELCTTYLGGTGCYFVRAQRMDTLQRSYGFICRCPACTDPTQRSDGRRELMSHVTWGLQQHIEGKRAGLFVPSSPAQALMQAEDLIAMLLDEGLVSVELMKAYRTASTQALAAGDFSKALEYAYNEAEIQRNCLGTEVDDLKVIGVDADTWITNVRAVLKKEGVPVRAPDGSIIPDHVPQSQSYTKKKKKIDKRKTHEKKKAEETADKLAERDRVRAEKTGSKQKGSKDGPGKGADTSKGADA